MTSCGSFWQSGTSTTAVIPVTVDVPAGALIVVSAVVNSNVALPGATATDTAGNSYVAVATEFLPSSPVVGSGILWANAAGALAAGDTITVSLASGTGLGRQAYVADFFTGVDSGGPSSLTSADGTDAAPTAGPVTPGAAGDYVVMCVGASSSSPATPDGFTLGSSLVTAAGSNERSVTSMYAVAPSTTPLSGSATLPAATSWSASIAAFATGDVPPPSGMTFSVLVGGAEVPLASLAVLSGGAEVPVTAWDVTP